MSSSITILLYLLPQLFLYSIGILVCVCVCGSAHLCVCVGVHHSAHVEIRGQLLALILSLHLEFRSSGLAAKVVP